MALNKAVGSFNTGTGTGTVAVTGVGFAPKAIIFWWNGRTGSADAAGGADWQTGIGWCTGTSNEGACYGQSQDAQFDSNTGRAHRTDACVGIMTPGATTDDGLLSLNSLDSDGFTLDIDNAFSADYEVHYWAIGGADVTNATTGSFTEHTAVETKAITGVGFQPDVVLFFSIGVGTAPYNASTNLALSIGAATGASNQAVLTVASAEAQATMATKSYCRAGEVWVNIGGTSTSPSSRAVLNSMDSDGFTLDFIKRSSTRIIFYMAIKGGQYHVGDFATATDTSNFSETGVGFQPEILLFGSHAAAATTADGITALNRWSLGAATSASARVSMGAIDDNATSDSETATATSHDEVYQNFATDDTLQGEMDLVSHDADGMTLVMDDADPSASFVWYLAAASAPIAPGGLPIPIAAYHYNHHLGSMAS